MSLERAREQHSAYVAALRGCGVAVTELDPEETLPDCVFVEDTAVIAGGVVVLSRPGHSTRRAEVPPIASALAVAGIPVAGTVEAPAVLDGGDVLDAGNVLIVGLSARTNAAGAEALAAAFGSRRSVLPVDLGSGDALHLKVGTGGSRCPRGG